jgi:hypothetical protein
MAEDADAAGLDAEQPRDQREQRALAGAVEAKQRGKARRRDGKADIDQRPPRAIGMAEAESRVWSTLLAAPVIVMAARS